MPAHKRVLRQPGGRIYAARQCTANGRLWATRGPGIPGPYPAAAQKRAEPPAAHFTAEPKNLEEQAINLVGTDIYEKLVKHYTEKQWGRPCTELPAFIIKRLPVRLIFDNNYFNALYQGIPNGGYTQMVANMLQGVEVRLGVNYLANKAELDALADRVIYTGPIDAYFDYSLGTLQYRLPQLSGQRCHQLHRCRNPVHPHH